MLAGGWLDVPLVIILLWQFRLGWVRGLFASACTLAGLAIGAVAAFFAIPLVNTWIPWSNTRPLIVAIAIILLLLGGYAVGRRVGQALDNTLRHRGLRTLNRAAGSALSVMITALLLSGVAMSISNSGFPYITQAIRDSALLRTIDTLTPKPAQEALAKLRSQVINEGIPLLIDQLGPAVVAPPDAAADTPELERASGSVVKITGPPFGCGQNQTGSGFVLAPEKVLTNAHVVAGVNQPIIQYKGGARVGEIVYLDPRKDLALIKVPNLPLEPIPLGQPQRNGTTTAFAGYPYGGPLRLKPALLSYEGTLSVPDIYGQSRGPRQVDQLAADVQPGNSGGPLLSLDGRAIGVIFAKISSGEPVGYALAFEELAPVVRQAPALNAAVSAGPCGAG